MIIKPNELKPKRIYSLHPEEKEYFRFLFKKENTLIFLPVGNNSLYFQNKIEIEGKTQSIVPFSANSGVKIRVLNAHEIPYADEGKPVHYKNLVIGETYYFDSELKGYGIYTGTGNDPDQICFESSYKGGYESHDGTDTVAFSRERLEYYVDIFNSENHLFYYLKTL